MSHGRHPEIDRLVEDASYAQAAAEAMQGLAAPSRLRILAQLRSGPASVSELSSAVGMEGSAVSHQLRLMRFLGLVTARREGRRMIYALHDGHVAELLEQIVAHVEHVRLGLSGRADRAATSDVRT